MNRSQDPFQRSSRLRAFRARRLRPVLTTGRFDHLEERTLLNASLIRDLNSTPSQPKNLTAVGNTLYFTTTTAAGATNLYATTGAAGAQTLLKTFPSTASIQINLDAKAVVGSKLFFAADDGTNGAELWVTEGTAASTHMVSDLNPNGSSVNALFEGAFATIGNTFYFIANNGSTGNEVYKTDATTGTTSLVKDVRPGSSTSIPQRLTALGSKLIFTAANGSSGRELYVSNGTAAGTFMLQDINTTTGSNPDNLTVVGSTLFFTAAEANGDRELWKTDGTSANTVRVKDILPGAAPSNPTSLVALGGSLIFAADDGTGSELWRSDGTEIGTVKIQDLSAEPAGSRPTSPITVGSNVYFITSTAAGGSDLWRTDGTTTQKLADLTASPIPDINAATAPRNLIATGSKLFLTFVDPATGGFVLWATDGTTAGTVRLRDLQPGATFAASIVTSGLMVGQGGQLYFADRDAQGVELWKSDGTVAGTARLKDINTGSNHSMPRDMTAMGGNVYFSAKVASGHDELWKSNGSAAGTVSLQSYATTNPAGSNISLSVQVGNTIIFFADDGVSGTELWKTDGTATGTSIVKDLVQIGGVTPYWITSLNGVVYFLIDGDSTASGLWRTDGSAAGTQRVQAIDFTTARPNVTAFNNSLYFALQTDFNVQLWRYNDDNKTTTTVIDDFPDSVDSISSIAVANNRLIFLTQDSRNALVIERWLWSSDGTRAGTSAYRSFSADGNPATEIVAYGNFAYFRANDGTSGSELWRTDGFAGGTTAVQDLEPGSDGSSPLHFQVVGGSLYFSATRAATGRELWRIDTPGGPAQMVLDANAGPSDSIQTGSQFASLGNTLYYTANNSQYGLELWKAANGQTSLVKDINPGSARGLSNDSARLTVINGTLYFAADNGTDGVELWTTDGTTAGTTLVDNINPGSAPSNPRVLGALPTGLIVSATTAAQGSELFLITTASPGANQAPTISPIADQTIDEGVFFTLPITASDPDAGQTLTFSLDPGAPPGLLIDSATGQIFWIPNESQGPGTYDVTIRALDNGNPVKTATRTFRITVREVNQAPILSAIGTQNATIGKNLTFTATATDPDSPQQGRVFSLINAPAGASIDPNSGVFNWTPTPGWGNTSFIVRAADPTNPSLFTQQTVSVIAQAAPVTVTNVTLVRKKANITGIQLTFSEGLNGGTVGNKNIYRLVKPGRDKKFGTKDDQAVKIKTIAYNAATNTITLTPKAAIPRAGQYQLTLNGQAGATLLDNLNRPLDGDRDGNAGGVYTARFQKGNLILASTTSLGTLSPSAIDIISIDQFFPPKPKGKK